MKKTRRIIAGLTSAFLMLSMSSIASAFSYSDLNSGMTVAEYKITEVAPETNHISLTAWNENGRQNINAVEFNPQNPYTTLRAGKSQGYVYSTQTVNTIATKMSDVGNGDTAIAAINGDYFTFGVGVPHGIFIEDGIILSTPPQYYAAFGMTYDNEPFIVRHGTILDKIFRIDGQLVEVAGINVAHAQNTSSLVLYTSDYARGTKTGTETYELRCRLNYGEVRHGGTINFTVEEIYNAVGNTSIGEGYIVLSAQGERMNDLKKLNVGDTLEMSFRFNEFWSNVKFAVGGIELLLSDGKIYSTADKALQPRTSIGIRPDGTVVMATFDGRQDGFASGMTYETAAKAMLGLGCTDAINLDGGGSTTFVLRTPGATDTKVVNSVSGSSPRQVANALVLMNTAPYSTPTNLSVYPANRLVLVGGAYNFEVTGAYDSNYKPYALPSDISWSTGSRSNTIDENGTLTAQKAGTETITARSGNAFGSVNLEIVDSVSTVVTDKTEITAKVGEEITINASATLDGRDVEAAPELFTWSAPETLGSFTEPGKFKLSENAVEGEITVSIGDTFTTVKVIPEIPPKLISDFETDDVSFVAVPISTKVNPNSKLETEGWLVPSGARSFKAYYNFLNTTGSVGSYFMVANDSADNSAFILSNIPKKLGMLVCGDGSGIELRSIIADANGVNHNISYGKIEHTGWKYMEATVPETIVGPIYIKAPIHLISNPEKLTHGVLYFDRLRAIYNAADDEDTIAPAISKAWPSENMVITTRNPSIGVIVVDDKELNPDTVEIWVNGYNCKDRVFDTENSKISYTVKNALKNGKHTILVRARDKSGNILSKQWTFEVKA